MGFLKKKNKVASSNRNEAAVTSAFAPTMKFGGDAANILAGLLGVPGSDGAAGAAGFERFKSLAGYAPALRDMQRGVTSTGASRGLLNSGATSKALLREGTNLNNGLFGNFLQQISGLAGIGQNAGQLVGNVGQGQSYQEASTGSKILKGVGKIASIFSDRRTKRDVTLLDRLEDGLGVYTFKYHWDDETRIGVMADEVEAIRPWALGPSVEGFQTVNYNAL